MYADIRWVDLSRPYDTLITSYTLKCKKSSSFAIYLSHEYEKRVLSSKEHWQLTKQARTVSHTHFSSQISHLPPLHSSDPLTDESNLPHFFLPFLGDIY